MTNERIKAMIAEYADNDMMLGAVRDGLILLAEIALRLPEPKVENGKTK